MLQNYLLHLQIPNNGLSCPSYKHLEPPFPVEKFHRLYRIIPMKEYHSVEINWALPSYLKHYKTKPLHYISHLLGHEGKGSILSYLKKKYVLEMFFFVEFHFHDIVQGICV